MTTKSVVVKMNTLWSWLSQQLERVYIPAAPSNHRLETLISLLPVREAQESLEHWLMRCRTKLTESGELKKWQQIVSPAFDLVVFNPSWSKSQPETKKYLAIKLVQIIRLAADATIEKYPLPDPDTALESENGVFRLLLTATSNNSILIDIQVRGAEIESFAGKRLGIVAVDDDSLIADIQLDEFASGQAEIDNTIENRHALLALIIVLLQAEDLL